ncbi:protein kinase, putative, partial [Entamoeba invadens IP1]
MVMLFVVLLFVHKGWTQLTCTPGNHLVNGICKQCPKATYSPNGTECIPCAPGSVTAQPETVSCKVCGKGTASDAAQEQCVGCVAGTYSDKDGATQCETCPPRTYSEYGAKECIECVGCVSCIANNSGKCAKCNPGYVFIGDRCGICPAGKYYGDYSTSWTVLLLVLHVIKIV